MSLSRILVSSVAESAGPEFDDVEIQDYSVEEVTEATVKEDYMDPAYDHEDGARLIAMETAEALHDVFLESFYGSEQCDILAIREGVALEGSQYETIMEGIASNAFETIKAILAKLWEKVIAFINSVIMFVDKFTLSGKDFFGKYDREFSKLKNLSGFKFKMYNYDDAMFNNAMDEHITIAVTNARTAVDNVGTTVGNALNSDGSVKEGDTWAQALDEVATTIDKLTDDESMYKLCSKNHAIDSKSFALWVFGLFRNGAKPGEKQEVAITDVYSKIQTIKNFKADPAKNIKKMTNSIYEEATNVINNVAATVQNAGGANANRAAGICRSTVTMLSKTQAIQNALITGWKDAVKERDAAYKQMAMSALAFSRGGSSVANAANKPNKPNNNKGNKPNNNTNRPNNANSNANRPNNNNNNANSNNGNNGNRNNNK